jgi:hypothetical protein
VDRKILKTSRNLNHDHWDRGPPSSLLRPAFFYCLRLFLRFVVRTFGQRTRNCTEFAVRVPDRQQTGVNFVGNVLTLDRSSGGLAARSGSRSTFDRAPPATPHPPGRRRSPTTSRSARRRTSGPRRSKNRLRISQNPIDFVDPPLAVIGSPLNRIGQQRILIRPRKIGPILGQLAQYARAPWKGPARSCPAALFSGRSPSVR